MEPAKLTSGKVYNYIAPGRDPVPITYCYETLNYWVFEVTITEPRLKFSKNDVLKNITEIC